MGGYDDIISLPHYTSKKHPRMPLEKRAAIFQPFAALTGYGAAVDEAGRLTENEVIQEEDALRFLDEKLAVLQGCLQDRPVITITFFEPDELKSGGSYRVMTGSVRRVRNIDKTIVMDDGTEISMTRILDMSGDIFPDQAAGPAGTSGTVPLKGDV